MTDYKEEMRSSGILILEDKAARQFEEYDK